jgi:hypothetical protein
VTRYFFVAAGVLFVLVAIAGFKPSYVDFFAGTFAIPPITHVHGALMMAWLLLLITQASLALSGSLKLHRTLGIAAIYLAAVIWISMWILTIRAFMVYPPEIQSFLPEPLLAQLESMILFPLFFVWAILQRRNPGSHKRLIYLATVVLLQAAVDRIPWLPSFGLRGFWPSAVGLDLVLAPLLIFDLLSIRRLHRITVIGALIILATHTIISLLWKNPAWDNWVHAITGSWH